MRPVALDHVSVVVADTGRALSFYSGLLGIPTAPRPDLGFPGAWLDLGGQQIHLLEVPNVDPVSERPEHGGRDRHIALAVPDITPFAERLTRAAIPFTWSRSGRRALFCRDPDGNGVELLQRGLP